MTIYSYLRFSGMRYVVKVPTMKGGGLLFPPDLFLNLQIKIEDLRPILYTKCFLLSISG